MGALSVVATTVIAFTVVIFPVVAPIVVAEMVGAVRISLPHVRPASSESNPPLEAKGILPDVKPESVRLAVIISPPLVSKVNDSSPP